MKRPFIVTLAVLSLMPVTARAANVLSPSRVAAGVPPFTQVATLLGPAPPTQSVHLVVHLAYPHPAQVAAFVQAVNDPKSPMYGAFLSPAQFTLNFGPSGHSYSTVEYALTNAGASVFATYANLKTMDVIATVEQADALFNTTINQYSYQNVV
jgi:kumamolisin